ncbi:MAG TPA: ACP S-malonyltransferase, partial [Phycisphaeraceae bacterium]
MSEQPLAIDQQPSTRDQATAFVLCPGQGAQHVGMGRAWFEQRPATAEVFAAADRALGFAISEYCFQGPADQLNRTDIAQPAIYTTSVACYRALAEAGELAPPAGAAGLSLGEFTALHLAGAFDFLDGLKLVHLRGQAMQEAAQAAPSGMVALVGADEQQAQELCDAARGDGVLVPANFNCPGQIVLSGTRDACERAVELASKMQLRATPLAVAGAFHSPLMQPAADR